MDNTLRIKENTTNGSPAVYSGVDIGIGGNICRGQTTPSMVRELTYPEKETVSFVYDTPHNRAYFLQRAGVETSVWQDNEWVVVPKSWLDKAFAPAKSMEPDEPATSPAGPDKKEVTDISTIEGFETIHKSQQKKALEALVSSEMHDDYKSKFLNDIIKSLNPNIANTTKARAEECLKEMANAVA